MRISELEALSKEIRSFLIEKLSQTGGHLSSNLGVVELTLAMHKVFDSPTDQLIFDVGHQGYVHKILTGRAAQFDTLRQADGLSGFLKRAESEHDVYEAGHSSTSLAAGAGMLFAKDYKADLGHIVMLIGDGAMASGMALEALNFMGHYPRRHPIIILNDNEMSISENIGYLSKILTRVRMKRSVRTLRRGTTKMIPKPLRGFTAKVEKRLKGFVAGHSYFEDLGYLYFGPLDGHNFKHLLTALQIAKDEKKPCIVHVRTQKGKGYLHSENDSVGVWHGVRPFEIETGDFLTKREPTAYISTSKAVANYLCHRASKEKPFYVITPAMIGGSELGEFQTRYGAQLIDVGIAEQTAVTMASGLALKGITPFVSIYSTFLQRAYDQVLHDVCRHQAHVVFGIDRAGLVGGDGETHQGIYDIPMLLHIPNIIVAHPKNIEEAYGLFNYAMDHQTGPMAIRFAKENIVDKTYAYDVEAITPSWEVLTEGDGVTVITFGSILEPLQAAIKAQGLSVTLINARYLKPLDTSVLDAVDVTKPIVTVEESILQGGLGSAIRDYYSDQSVQIKQFKRLGFDALFVQQGKRETMLARYGLDVDGVLKSIKELL